MPYTKPHFEDDHNLYTKPQSNPQSVYLKPHFGDFKTNYKPAMPKKKPSLEKSKPDE